MCLHFKVSNDLTIVGCCDVDKLSHYLIDFHSLLSLFYLVNKLKINHDKTEMLVTCKNKFRIATTNLTFKAVQFIINQSDYITIL